MRRLATLLCILSAVLLLTLDLHGAGEPGRSLATKPGLVGDVNGDGIVNSVDSALIVQLTAGTLSSLPSLKNADVDGDGTGDIIDAALILQFTAGFIDSLPPPVPPSLGEPGTATLRVGSEVGTINDETVPIDLRALEITEPGLGAWVVDIVYDPGIVSVEACHPGSGGRCNRHFRNDTVRVVGANAEGLQGEVELATITFRCHAQGIGNLDIVPAVMADATVGSPQEMTVSVESGAVTCLSPEPTPTPAPPEPGLLGDANCSGATNSVDASVILQLSAGLVRSLPCPEAARVNRDGRVDVIDATLILQFSAGLIPSLSQLLLETVGAYWPDCRVTTCFILHPLIACDNEVTNFFTSEYVIDCVAPAASWDMSCAGITGEMVCAHSEDDLVVCASDRVSDPPAFRTACSNSLIGGEVLGGCVSTDSDKGSVVECLRVDSVSTELLTCEETGQDWDCRWEGVMDFVCTRGAREDRIERFACEPD